VSLNLCLSVYAFPSVSLSLARALARSFSLSLSLSLTRSLARARGRSQDSVPKLARFTPVATSHTFPSSLPHHQAPQSPLSGSPKNRSPRQRPIADGGARGETLLQPRFSKLPWGGQLVSEEDGGGDGGSGGGGGERVVFENVSARVGGGAKSPVSILKGVCGAVWVFAHVTVRPCPCPCVCVHLCGSGCACDSDCGCGTACGACNETLRVHARAQEKGEHSAQFNLLTRLVVRLVALPGPMCVCVCPLRYIILYYIIFYYIIFYYIILYNIILYNIILYDLI